MGFLDKLFAKKICDICGGEIGLLGNKKLEDGNCCKDCAKKLSPWFDERRHSTIEQIKSQLAYREQNAKELEGFSADAVIGDYYKMFVELKDGVPYRFVVSGSDDFKAQNADIIMFKNVSSCDLKIRDSRTEQKYTNDKNERVSYNPPRYEYHYDFYIELGIANTPWFDDINLRINRSTLTLETVSRGNSIFIKDFDPMLYPEYRELKAMCDEICNYVSCGQNGIVCSSAGNNANPQTVETVQEQPAVAVANTWKCESCGSENTGKFCEGCGAPKPASATASASGWKCFCGTVNEGKFCQSCGTPKFAPEDIECSNCSWTADTWHEDVGVPAMCPNCGKEFNSDDIS